VLKQCEEIKVCDTGRCLEISKLSVGDVGGGKVGGCEV